MLMQSNFQTARPQFVDVSGADLESKLAELRAQGAHIQRMDVVDNALWRLHLIWRDPDDKPSERPGGRRGYFRVKHTDHYKP